MIHSKHMILSWTLIQSTGLILSGVMIHSSTSDTLSVLGSFVVVGTLIIADSFRVHVTFFADDSFREENAEWGLATNREAAYRRSKYRRWTIVCCLYRIRILSNLSADLDFRLLAFQTPRQTQPKGRGTGKTRLEESNSLDRLSQIRRWDSCTT